eukprot:6197010-Pleurochrysis_carterae.AAC.4
MQIQAALIQLGHEMQTLRSHQKVEQERCNLKNAKVRNANPRCSDGMLNSLIKSSPRAQPR